MSHVSEFVKEIKEADYTTISSVRNDLLRANQAFEEFEKGFLDHVPENERVGYYAKVGAGRGTLSLANRKFRPDAPRNEIYQPYRKFVASGTTASASPVA